MKLIKPSFKILEQSSGIEGIYKHIEVVGRTCYRSEDKITEDSAKEFVERMVKLGHGAMLEHGTVYLMCYFGDKEEFDKNKVIYHHKKPSYEKAMDYLFINGDEDAWYAEKPDHIASKLFVKYQNNEYSKVVPFLISKKVYPKGVLVSPDGNGGISLRKPNSQEPFISSLGGICITTNYRVLVENGWLDDLEYLCEPTEYHEKRITIKFIMDRIGSQSFCRHRVFSFAQESTRYCNYSKDKFGNEITCILPIWSNLPEGEYEVDGVALNKIGQKERVEYTPDEQFLEALTNAEWNYFHLLQLGWTPQQARAVLPNALKTELVMTGFVDDWKHFFELRCASNAHPQAQELAIPLRQEFINKKIL